jgi:hypothetical protein
MPASCEVVSQCHSEEHGDEESAFFGSKLGGKQILHALGRRSSVFGRPLKQPRSLPVVSAGEDGWKELGMARGARPFPSRYHKEREKVRFFRAWTLQ